MSIEKYHFLSIHSLLKLINGCNNYCNSFNFAQIPYIYNHPLSKQPAVFCSSLLKSGKPKEVVKGHRANEINLMGR